LAKLKIQQEHLWNCKKGKKYIFLEQPCSYTTKEEDKLILEHKEDDNHLFHLAWLLYKKDLYLSKFKAYS
jgi:hypothetical protein